MQNEREKIKNVRQRNNLWLGHKWNSELQYALKIGAQ